MWIEAEDGILINIDKIQTIRLCKHINNKWCVECVLDFDGEILWDEDSSPHFQIIFQGSHKKCKEHFDELRKRLTMYVASKTDINL